MTPFQSIAERIRAQVDPAKVLADAGKLVGGDGKRGNVICPFHKEATPSLSLRDGRFHCFGCSASGDVIDLESRLTGASTRDAALALAQRYGIPTDEMRAKPLPRGASEVRIVGQRLHDYLDPQGRLILRKVRWARSDGTKTFTQWRPATEAEIKAGAVTLRPDGRPYLKPAELKKYHTEQRTFVPPVCVNSLEGYEVEYPYQADRWYGCAKLATMIKTEGEKDAEIVTRGPYVGTCSHCGANKPWSPAMIASLVSAGVREILHFADCDLPGLQCLLRDVAQFQAAGIRCRYVSLIGQIDSRDGSRIDWAEKHGADIYDVIGSLPELQRKPALEALVATALDCDAAWALEMGSLLKSLEARWPREGQAGAPRQAKPAAPAAAPAANPAAADAPAIGALAYAPSDSGNALRLLALCGDRIKWVIADQAGRGDWATWQDAKDASGARLGGGRWVYPVGDEVILALTREVYEALEEEAGRLDMQAVMAEQNVGPEDAERYIRRARDFALNSQSADRRSAMVRLLKAEPSLRVPIADFDADRWLLNCRNGVVDLRTGELRPARKTDLFLKMARASYKPGLRPLTFLHVLSYSQHDDPAKLDCLQRWFGYNATGDVGEEKFMVWWGPNGRNGKSKISEAVAWALGDYSGSCPSDFLTAKDREGVPTDVADLKGLRHCIISEPEEGMKLALSKMKLLTGGDTIKARRMNRDFFEFKPSHKMTMLTNERPAVRGNADAIWNRIILVPFTRTVPESERILDLTERLQAECDGILSWIVAGAALWRQSGLRMECFAKATKEWQADEDIFGDFLAACTIADEGAAIKKADLYKAYKAWAEREHVVLLPPQVVGRILAQRGLAEERIGKARDRYWKGLRARTEQDDRFQSWRDRNAVDDPPPPPAAPASGFGGYPFEADF